MFNWLRGLTHSAEKRRQERTIAYVDGKLSQKESAQFAAELVRDAALQKDVAELQQIKTTLQAIPRQPVPRNFILDPTEFAKVKPKPAYDVRLYPVLQGATVLAALLFIVMGTLTFTSKTNGTPSMQLLSAPETASNSVAMLERSEVIPPDIQLEEAAEYAAASEAENSEIVSGAAEMSEMIELPAAEIAQVEESVLAEPVEEINEEVASAGFVDPSTAASSGIMEDSAEVDASSPVIVSSEGVADDAPVEESVAAEPIEEINEEVAGTGVVDPSTAASSGIVEDSAEADIAYPIITSSDEAVERSVAEADLAAPETIDREVSPPSTATGTSEDSEFRAPPADVLAPVIAPTLVAQPTLQSANTDVSVVAELVQPADEPVVVEEISLIADETQPPTDGGFQLTTFVAIVAAFLFIVLLITTRWIRARL